MSAEPLRTIIVNPDVPPSVETRIRSSLEAFNAMEIAKLTSVEDKGKKSEINFERIRGFLDTEIDESKIFLVHKDKYSSLQLKGLENIFPDGFYRVTGDYIVVLFSETETEVSIEQKIVHELFHKAGLSILVINQSYVAPKRLGFSLDHPRKIFGGNSSPGKLIEEMAASYAGWAYLQKYAGSDYWSQVDDYLLAENADMLAKQLGKKYVLLNSNLEAMTGNSLYVYLFDCLSARLGNSSLDPQKVTQIALDYRKDAVSLRKFIRDLEIKVGKGTYALLRGVDLSSGEVDAASLQRAINLLEKKSPPNSSQQEKSVGFEGKMTDPTEAAVSYAPELTFLIEGELTRLRETGQFRSFDNSQPIQDSPASVNELIELLGSSIEKWVALLLQMFQGADQATVRHKIESIIRERR